MPRPAQEAKVPKPPRAVEAADGLATTISEIEAWLEQVSETYNILSMDAQTFRSWARLMHRRPYHLIEEATIAASHNLIVVTRNVRDFEDLGVRTLNPFDMGRD